MPKQTFIINGDPFDVDEDVVVDPDTQRLVTTRRIRRRPWWKRFWSGVKMLWGSK